MNPELRMAAGCGDGQCRRTELCSCHEQRISLAQVAATPPNMRARWSRRLDPDELRKIGDAHRRVRVLHRNDCIRSRREWGAGEDANRRALAQLRGRRASCG